MPEQTQPQQLRRRAQRLGFGTPTLKEAGLGRYSLEFQLPDMPPTTLSRPIESAIILTPPEKGMEPDPMATYTRGEVTVRFPQAPEFRFEQGEALDAAETAWANAGLGGIGRVRLNQVVENQHAVHYDIDRNESLPVGLGEFLSMVWDAAEGFNDYLKYEV